VPLIDSESQLWSEWARELNRKGQQIKHLPGACDQKGVGAKMDTSTL
jgi:hypothetical protein